MGESESANGIAEDSVSELLDEELLIKVSSAKDAQEALKIFDEMAERKNGGVVSVSDCCNIISASLKRNNPELALSVFYEMRASFDQGSCFIWVLIWGSCHKFIIPELSRRLALAFEDKFKFAEFHFLVSIFVFSTLLC